MLAAALVTAFAGTGARAQTESAGAPPITLKPSRDLTPLSAKAPRATTSDRGVSRLTLDDPERGAIFLRADRLEGAAEERIEASGRVELRTRRETILADWLAYDFARDEIHAKGNVVIRRGTDMLTGPEVIFRRGDETGSFTSPRFTLGELGGRGDAETLTFAGPDHYEILKGRFTTCVAPRSDWFLLTDRLEIDRVRNVGTATDATVRFFDVPILAAPRLEFPLSDERKSGFLTPTAASSSTNGFEFAIPYYFNLAPNYDATVTPRIMTKRGILFGGQFRYLFGDPQPMEGRADVQFLPDDRQTGTNRYEVLFRHNQQIAPWLTGYVNVQKVSDDLYFADLADRVGLTSQTTLPREAGLVAIQGPWSVITRVRTFQTLQDPGAPITPPYNQLPQVQASLAELDYRGLTFSGYADYANFRQSPLPAGLPEGNRFVLYPTVSWTRQAPAWFFTARAGIHLRKYDLETNPNAPDDLDPFVAVPITSLDGGLVFERPWTVFGREFVQTLEPRAFYVYAPFRQQSQIPVFDTAEDDFNFSQLFSENSFLGNDRIADASALTLAVTSRLLDPRTGAERMRFALGQRFFFQTQFVTLPNQPVIPAGTSDFLAGVEGKLSDVWALNGLLQYDFGEGELERLNGGVRYTPGAGRVINAIWRYTRQSVDPFGAVQQIKQTDLSAQWPVNENLTLLGRWNYSFIDRKTLEALAGFEYNRDCWVLRFVYHRLTTTTQQVNNSVYLQLELNGLGRVGTSPLELLRRNVPGYRRTNEPGVRDVDSFADPLPDF